MDKGELYFRNFLSGDESGMTKLVKDYGDSLMLYLNNYVNDIDTAEELMQETFIELVLKKSKFNPKKSSFKTWLYTIGRYTAIDYLRKNSKHKKVTLDDYPELESKSDIETELLKKDQNQNLYKVMKSLKSEYCQVLYLIYFENFSNTETAKIMRKSKKQIENLLYNARKALKNELERSGFVYEEL